MQQASDASSIPATRPPQTSRKRKAGVAVLVAIIVVAFVGMMFRMTYVPSDLDTATMQTTAEGLYRISYVAEVQPVPVNQMHSWVLRVETPDGAPVLGATIDVDGDMPQHAHGLPTRPQVTAELGNGEYRVEGIRFHMQGWWVIDFTIESEGRQDSVRFNLMLQ